jgi:hypothetical protein
MVTGFMLTAVTSSAAAAKTPTLRRAWIKVMAISCRNRRQNRAKPADKKKQSEIGV